MAVDRHALVMHQLRDKHGRWIKMGFHVSWGDDDGDDHVGTVVGVDDDHVLGSSGPRAIVRLYGKHGEDLGVTQKIDPGKLSVIEAKAFLHYDEHGHLIEDPHAHLAEPAKHQFKAETISPHEARLHGPSVTTQHAEHHGVTTKLSDVKVGDELYPVSSYQGNNKSPYNLSKAKFNPSLDTGTGKSLGTVTENKPNKDYIKVKDANGKVYYPAKSHWGVVRNADSDKALLDAHKTGLQNGTAVKGRWTGNLADQHPDIAHPDHGAEDSKSLHAEAAAGGLSYTVKKDGEKVTTQVSQLKPGDQVYQLMDAPATGSYKNPYGLTSGQNSAHDKVSVSGKGVHVLGTVIGDGPTGLMTIKSSSGHSFQVPKSSWALKRTPETDKALLNASEGHPNDPLHKAISAPETPHAEEPKAEPHAPAAEATKHEAPKHFAFKDSLYNAAPLESLKKEEDFNNLPAGSVIKEKANGNLFVKGEDGSWQRYGSSGNIHPNGGSPYGSWASTTDGHTNHHMYTVYTPKPEGSSHEEPKAEDKFPAGHKAEDFQSPHNSYGPATGQLKIMPIGTIAQPKGASGYFVKTNDNGWQHHNAAGVPGQIFTAQQTAGYLPGDTNLWMPKGADMVPSGNAEEEHAKLHAPAAPAEAPHAEAPHAEGPFSQAVSPDGVKLMNLTEDGIKNAPAGSTLTAPGHGTITKGEDGKWHSTSGSSFTNAQIITSSKTSSGHKYTFNLPKNDEPKAEAPKEEAHVPHESAPSAHAESAPHTPVEGPYKDKGKTVVNAEGKTLSVNMHVTNDKFGHGIITTVMPATNGGSVKVKYDGEPKEKVTLAKNLKVAEAHAPEHAPEATHAPAAEVGNLAPGEAGVHPTQGKYLGDKNGKPLFKGDKVSYTKKGETSTGTVNSLYHGEKTVAVKWDDGSKTGPKKASTLSKVEAPQGEHVPNAPEAPSAAPEHSASVADVPHTPEAKQAMSDFLKEGMQINAHLRGTSENAHAGAEGKIYNLDSVIQQSTLNADTSVYRAFKLPAAQHGNNTNAVLNSLVPGAMFFDKGFTSTSLDPAIAEQALSQHDGVHSITIEYNLPKGFHAMPMDYKSIDGGEQFAHQQEVVLPRNFNFEVSHADVTHNADGSVTAHLKLKGVVKDASDALNSADVHEVAANEHVDSHPFVMAPDPGKSGDGFHPSGPWGHYGAAGLLVGSKNEKAEPVFLIVENGELHEAKNQGLWQLPGGAIDEHETPYTGAAREMHEELGVSPDLMKSIEHVGDIQFSNGKGWNYTNIAGMSEKPFDVKIDVIETSDYKWATKEELAQMQADGKILPALSHNLDNILGLYDNHAGFQNLGSDAHAAGDTTHTGPDKPLNISDFQKMPGSTQGGSNSGALYTEKSTGDKYYIKWGMSEDHADNEVLASKIYQAMGVNAANQQLIDMGNGKVGVASKIIENHGGSSHAIHDPEFKKKAQEDFAVDALLANWDVAGMGMDNLMVDKNGNPLRVDPGASLRYRAQGAKKSDFGKSVGEWNYLRDGSNHESSGLPYNKKVFGDMTDQQLKDSAAKLHTLTDAKIDSIVDSVPFDKKDNEYFKEVLKARRDDIFKRAGIEGIPNNEEQAHDAGTPAGHEAPAESGPVSVDSGSGDGGGTPAAPAGGSGAGSALDGKKLSDVSEEDLKAAPTGTKVINEKGDFYTKGADGQWHSGHDNTSFGNDTLLNTKSIGHGDKYRFETPKSEGTPEEPKAEEPAAPSSDLSSYTGKTFDKLPAESIKDLPVGTKLVRPTGAYYQKVDDNAWRSFKSDGTYLTGVINNDGEMGAVHTNVGDILTMDVPSSAHEDTPSSESLHGKTMEGVTKEHLDSLPAGTKLLDHTDSNGDFYEKNADGSWTFTTHHDGEPYKNAPESSQNVHNYITDNYANDGGWNKSSKFEISLPQDAAQAPAASEASAPSAVQAPDYKPGDKVDPAHLESLPEGSNINVLYWNLTKGSDGKWHGTAGTFSTDALMTSAYTDDITLNTLPGAPEPKVGDKLDASKYESLPVGSVIKPEGSNNTFEKIAQGQWLYTQNGVDKYSTENLSGYYGSAEVTKVGDGTSEHAPKLLNTGDTITEPQQVHDMPLKSQIGTQDGKVWTKTDENTWKANTGQTMDSIDMVNKVMEDGNATFNGTQSENPSLTGKHGQQIFVGDNVVWENKGVKGKVMGLDEVNNKVQMLTDENKVKWYSANKLASLPKESAAPQMPKPTAAADPSSPWYEKPKPELEVSVAKPDASHLPEGFLAEIQQRYADHVNPSWSKTKTDPKESGYWSKIESFMNSSSPTQSELNFIHEKMYISDAMYQQASDKLKAYDAAMADYKKAVEDATSKYQQDVKAWKAANGIVSKGLVDLPPRDFGKSWTPENGYITNADGTQGVNWTLAPEGSYSVDKILNTFSDDEAAKHGMSAMIDSSDIVDNNVRFTKISDANGVERVQARFEISEASRQKIMDAMSVNGGQKTNGVQNGFLGFVTKGFSKFISGVKSLTGNGQDDSGSTFDKHVNGVDVKFQTADYIKHSGEYKNNTGAMRAMAYVTLPENGTTADFEKGLKALGITDAHPSTEAAVDFSRRKKIVSTFKGFIAEGDKTYENNPNKLMTDSNAVLAELGKKAEDFQLVHTGLGFYQFTMPQDLRDKLTEQSKVNYLMHGNYDWIPIDKNRHNYGGLGEWTPDQGVDRITNRFTNGAKGVMSTARRMLEGDDAKGMSPAPDIHSGGSRYLFMGAFRGSRKATDANVNYNDMSGSTYQTGIVAHPSIAFKYLGNTGNASDNGDGKRQTGRTLMDILKDHGPSSSIYEVQVHNGLAIEDSWFYYVNAKQKPLVIEKLHEAGVDEINGIPIEEYFVVPGDKIPAYNEIDPTTLGLPKA